MTAEATNSPAAKPSSLYHLEAGSRRRKAAEKRFIGYGIAAIAAGLFFGKIGGVLGVTWLMVRMGWARLPTGASWTHMLGVSALAGIGFTMSLFIGTLSFPDATQMNEVRLGVLGGSAIAAVFGYLVLRLAPSVESGVRKAASTDTPITPGSPTTAGQTGA